MIREIISAVIGAGIVGLAWTFTSVHQKPAAVPPAKAPFPEPAVSPGKLKKELSGVYSATPDRNFPGLKLYSTDFLIPINRMHITEHVVFDDPKGDYGSGGMPMCAILFSIEEKDKHHYFFTSGAQWRQLSELVYLGENIEISKVDFSGNGFIMATYKDGKGRKGNGFVSVSNITGSDPVTDTGAAQQINLDPLRKYAEKCDPFVWKINAEQFWKIFQKAIRENDRMTVAKMISFPMDHHGETFYNRMDFIRNFDRIFDKETKENILKTENQKPIGYSWRGAELPNGSWLIQAYKAQAPAGPLTL